ncbi:MAG: hypothetical protein AAF170_02850 [Bacteroidota bacterium]
MAGFLIGLTFAAVLVAAARTVGFDRDAAFYPTVLVVIALLYVLFAVEDGGSAVVAWEVAVAAVFVAVAVAGYKRNEWWLVVGYAAHGLYDVAHGGHSVNTGVPLWWGGFCLGVDGAIAAYLAVRARQTAV